LVPDVLHRSCPGSTCSVKILSLENIYICSYESEARKKHMRIKLGQLKAIIREVAEGGGDAIALGAAIDDLTERWNDWISLESNEGPFMGSGAKGERGAKYIDGVRVILGDENASRWSNAAEYAALPEAQEFARGVAAIPWPSDDVTIRGAILALWAGESRYARPWLEEQGIAAPTPRVRLGRSAFAGGITDWGGVLLGGLGYSRTVSAMEKGVNEMRRKERLAADASAAAKKKSDELARRRELYAAKKGRGV
jgi:hypothetical protein